MSVLDGPAAGGEYLTAGLSGGGPPATPVVSIGDCELLSSNIDLQSAQDTHFNEIHLVVTSANGCRLHFSQFYTRFLRVRAAPDGQVSRADDGTTDIALGAGRQTVDIDRRGLWSFVWGSK
jgi:hypothetical protein